MNTDSACKITSHAKRSKKRNLDSYDDSNDTRVESREESAPRINALKLIDS